MADQAGTPPLAGPNPFVGPRALDVGERLFGRRHEVQELSYLLSAERVVLLYAPSGAGKSSLVQAGLIPDLRDQFDVWRPARVNRELDADDDPRANRYVLSMIRSFEDGLPESQRRPHQLLAKQTLTDYRAGRPKSEGAPNATVLIIDQFEEILTVDPLGIIQKREFFDQLGSLLHNQRVWALFVLREDFLPQLDPYERHIPTGFGNRFRLDLLGTQSAKKAMQSTAETAGRTFTEAALDQLVQDLATVNVQRPDGKIERAVGRHVEPVNLQVVCRQLWDKMERGDLRIDPEDVTEFGDVTEALAGYYTASVKRVSDSKSVSERKIREWFGDRLIRGGTVRGQVPLDKDVSGGLRNTVIAALLRTHLIRSEERTTGTWFELAHDRLIKPIVASNEAWRTGHLEPVQRLAAMWDAGKRPDHALLIDADLVKAVRWAEKVNAKDGEITGIEGEFLERSHAAQVIANRERANSRFIKIAGVVAVVAAVAASYLWIDAVQAREAADLAREAAEMARRTALNAQAAAETSAASERQQTEVAVAAEERARIARAEAESQAKNAIAQRMLAEEATEQAEDAQGEAVKQALAAEAARVEAAAAAKQARLAQRVAEAARDDANKQRAAADTAEAQQTRDRFLSRADEAASEALVRPDDELFQAANQAAEAYLRYCQYQDELVVPTDPFESAQLPAARRCRPGERDRSVLIGLQTTLNRLTLMAAGTSTQSWAGGVVASGQGGSVLLLALAASGTSLLAAGPGGSVIRSILPQDILPWPRQAPPEELDVELGRRVLSVAAHPHGHVLASGDADGQIQIYVVDTTADTTDWPTTLQLSDAVTSLAFSADGSRLAAGTVSGQLAMQTHGGTEPLLHDLAGGAIHTLLLIPPGGTMAAGTLMAGTNAGLHRCDAFPGQTPRCDPPLRYQENPREPALRVRALAFEPDHDWLAVGGHDGTIRVGKWDEIHQARPFPQQHRSAVNTLSFDTGGRLLASGGDDGTVRIWPIDERNLDRPNQVAVFEEGEGWIQTVAFGPHPIRPLLYSGSANGTVRVWVPHMDPLASAVCQELKDLVPVLTTPSGNEVVNYCERFAKLPPPGPDESASP